MYVFTNNPTQRFPLYSLPHNQYLAPARTCMVLGQLEGYEGAELCAERARMMATYFHDNLRLTDEGAYEWNYWDPLEGEDVRSYVEDTGHGTIDVGFAAEATRRGVVFTNEDMERFARMDKGDFVGREALAKRKEDGVALSCVYLDVEDGDSDPRGNEPIYDGDGERIVGVSTSGGYGYAVGKTLAFAYVEPQLAQPGSKVEIEILGQRRAASVLAGPVYDPRNERLKA